jgi:hypothetical protein
VGGDSIRQLVLYERNFGWMDVWDLNPQVLGSLWLMASATWGGGGKHRGLRPLSLRKVGRAPSELYPGNCLTTEKNLSQGSRLVGHYSLRQLGRIFRDSLGWPTEHQSTSVTHVWHNCLPSCRSKGFPASALFVETPSQCSDVVGEK